MKRLVLAPSSVGVTNTLFSRRSTVKALRFPTATIVTASDSSMTVRWSFAVSTRRTVFESGFWVSSFCAIKPSVIVAAATEIVRNDFIWLVPPSWFGHGQEPHLRRAVIPGPRPADRFDASNRISSITSARPVSRGFLRDTSRGWLSNGLCRRRYPRYLPRSGNFELPVANFTRARTVRERMNPLNATTVKNNLTIPRHRHQEGCLGKHLTVSTFDLLDKETTSLVVDFDDAFAHLRYLPLDWTAAGSLDNRFQHLVGKRVERKRARRLVALRAADHRVERLQPSHAILLLVPGPSADEPDQ